MSEEQYYLEMARNYENEHTAINCEEYVIEREVDYIFQKYC